MIPPESFEAAWALYRSAEVRLPRPPARSPHAPPTCHVSGLNEVIATGRYDAVLLDAWGVLNLGDAPLPAARAAFASLRASGLAVRVVSNDAGSDSEQSSARHGRRGFDVRPEEIVFGLDLLAGALEALGVPPDACALIAPRPAPRAALTDAMVDLDAPAAREAAAIVFLSTVGYTEATHARLRSLLSERPRPLVVCNPDIVSPEPVGNALEPGLYAHALADELGLDPLFLGKPFPAVYDAVLATLPGVARHRVLCVGDTLHTDVLGGLVSGLDTMLVESGFFRGEDLAARCAEAGMAPTYWAPHL